MFALVVTVLLYPQTLDANSLNNLTLTSLSVLVLVPQKALYSEEDQQKRFLLLAIAINIPLQALVVPRRARSSLARRKPLRGPADRDSRHCPNDDRPEFDGRTATSPGVETRRSSQEDLRSKRRRQAARRTEAICPLQNSLSAACIWISGQDFCRLDSKRHFNT